MHAKREGMDMLEIANKWHHAKCTRSELQAQLQHLVCTWSLGQG